MRPDVCLRRKLPRYLNGYSVLHPSVQNCSRLTQARADLQGRYDAGKPKRRMDESGGGDGMLHGGGGGSEKVERQAPPLLPMSFLKTSPLTGTRSESKDQGTEKREATNEWTVETRSCQL